MCTLECVVVSQNEFLDSDLAYFNVFLNFGVGSKKGTSGKLPYFLHDGAVWWWGQLEVVEKKTKLNFDMHFMD